MDGRERMQSEFTRQGSRMLSSPAFDAAALARQMEPLLGEAGRGRVLEWACGPGLLARELAPRADRYVGVDLTHAMLALARANASAAEAPGVQGQPRYLQGAVETLPFPDASFDAAVSRLAVHHLADPGPALAEVARVLRPGGLSLIADIEGCIDPGDALLNDAIETLRDPTHVRLLSAPELDARLAEAGFAVRAEERFVRDRRFADWASLVGDDTRTGPLEIVMRSLAEAGRDAGIGLRIEAGEIRFLHRWRVVSAERV